MWILCGSVPSSDKTSARVVISFGSPLSTTVRPRLFRRIDDRALSDATRFHKSTLWFHRFVSTFLQFVRSLDRNNNWRVHLAELLAVEITRKRSSLNLNASRHAWNIWRKRISLSHTHTFSPRGLVTV